jgi:hypothetical protein
MASDSIEQLSRIAPVSDEDAARVFGAAGKENLLDAITALSPGRGRSTVRRLRRPLVLGFAVLAVAGATGAAWAMTRGSARDTTSVDCVVQGVDSIVDATSGDPAADCVSVWESLTGKPAPPLTAYDNDLGGVAVLPTSQKPPANWTPIASQNVALIELQETLLDNINGPDSACFSSSEATAFAQQQLNRLGLIGWSVSVRRPEQQQSVQPPAGTKAAPGVSGGQSCYGGYADPTTRTVVLGGGGDQAGPVNSPPHQLADSLRPLTQQCLSLAAMKSEVVQRATALGMSQTVENDHNYELSATQDNTMRCSTVYETVGGTIDVVVRGPAAP